MKPGDSEALVRNVVDAFNRRDFDSMLEWAHEDLVFLPVTERLGFIEGPFLGPAGFERYLNEISSIIPDLRLEAMSVRAAGDAVVMLGRAHGSGPQGELDAAGTWVWKLRDDKLIRCEVFSDEKAAYAALGLPASGAAEGGERADGAA
jgi:ketosteroid isomerase-like protein